MGCVEGSAFRRNRVGCNGDLLRTHSPVLLATCVYGTSAACDRDVLRDSHRGISHPLLERTRRRVEGPPPGHPLRSLALRSLALDRCCYATCIPKFERVTTTPCAFCA